MNSAAASKARLLSQLPSFLPSFLSFRLARIGCLKGDFFDSFDFCDGCVRRLSEL
jgi:hypothetical protein